MVEPAHTEPLTGSPQGRLGGRVRGVRGAKTRGHDFNDPDLYARMRSDSRRIYHRAFGIIADADWDEAFNFAYGQAWNSERRKGPIDQLASWLTTAAHNAVVSEFRKTARVDLLADEETLTGQTITDLAETVEERQLLRDAISCLKTSLPERVRLVWTMRFAGDYEPSEIQRRLKLTRKGYEKDLEHATRVIVSRLESARASGICSTPDMASMVRAYAIWGERDGAERAKVAREHLAQCSACRGTIRALRAARRAAAFFPPPLLPFVVSHQPPLAVIPRTIELRRTYSGRSHAHRRWGTERAGADEAAPGEPHHAESFQWRERPGAHRDSDRHRRHERCAGYQGSRRVSCCWHGGWGRRLPEGGRGRRSFSWRPDQGSHGRPPSPPTFACITAWCLGDICAASHEHHPGYIPAVHAAEAGTTRSGHASAEREDPASSYKRN